MDVDLSEIETLSRPKRPECSVGQFLARSDEQTRATFTAALEAAADPEHKITYAGVSKWLASKGHKLNDSTIRRHGRGDCTCGDD